MKPFKPQRHPRTVKNSKAVCERRKELALTGDAMTEAEKESLKQCESVIANGRKVFEAVGSALAKIRDERLYRQTHGTFEHYCQDRWGFSKSYGNMLVAAAAVAKNIGNNCCHSIQNEAQARELSKLSPDEQVKVWNTATAADGELIEV